MKVELNIFEHLNQVLQVGMKCPAHPDLFFIEHQSINHRT